jgi:hypothetical protein
MDMAQSYLYQVGIPRILGDADIIVALLLLRAHQRAADFATTNLHQSSPSWSSVQRRALRRPKSKHKVLNTPILSLGVTNGTLRS